MTAAQLKAKSGDYIVNDISLAKFGHKEISLAETEMPGLMATREEFSFIPTPAKTAQEVAMIEDFADLAASGDATKRAGYATADLICRTSTSFVARSRCDVTTAFCPFSRARVPR